MNVIFILQYFFILTLAQAVERTWLYFVVSTKTWNDLKTPKPPRTTYNHLQPPQKFQQPPQKHLQPLANHLEQGINVYNKARRQHVTYSNETSTSP